MSEPILFHIPLTLLFLYFIFYSFLGWCVETTYCCIVERRFVARGFLLGPVCPIYGTGVLIMILLLRPFAVNLPVFFLVATVTMSAWEYFVGWLLETTTHVKYWDYSDKKFNLKGRICLEICLCWGALSYIAVFLIHPAVTGLFEAIPSWIRYCLTGSAFTLLAVDSVSTVQKLALTARVMARMDAVGQQLQLQAALGRAELSDRLDSAIEALPVGLRNRIDDLREAVPDTFDEAGERLRAKYLELAEAAERHSRRFRSRYRGMSSKRFSARLDDVKNQGDVMREKLRAAKEEYKREKAARQKKR